MTRQQPETTTVAAYAWSLALVVGITGVALLGRNAFHLPDVVMLYLLAILIASFRFGRGPAITAAALSVATYDFFFVPPFYTLSVEHARHVMTFAMMFGLGLVVSNIASRLRQQERQTRLREEHTAALYALSRESSACRMPPPPRRSPRGMLPPCSAGRGGPAQRQNGAARDPRARRPGGAARPVRPGGGALGQRVRPPRRGRNGDFPERRGRLHSPLRRSGPARRARALPADTRGHGLRAPRLPRGVRAAGRLRESSGCVSPRRRKPQRCARAARRCAARC